MTKVQNNESSNDISDRTNFKLPISLFVGAVVGFSVFLFTHFEHKFEVQHASSERKFSEAREDIRIRAADRYTGVEARQFAESIKQLFLAIKEKNDISHASYQRQINRNKNDIDRHDHAIATIKGE